MSVHPYQIYIDRFREWLAEVECADLEFVVFLDGDRPILQVSCPDGQCNVSGQPMAWKGRKWFLSIHMTKSEVIQTAFKAVLTAVEHELRETFRYRGQAIFGPHFSVDVMADLISQRGKAVEDAREAKQ